MLLLPLFSMGGVLVLVISEMVACSGDNTYKDDDSTGLIECEGSYSSVLFLLLFVNLMISICLYYSNYSLLFEGDWTLLCFIGSLFTFMMFMLEGDPSNFSHIKTCHSTKLTLLLYSLYNAFFI